MSSSPVGPLTPGIIFLPNGIVLESAGIYSVSFSVTAIEPNQMTLFLNGNAVSGSTYGSSAGTQQNTGQVLVGIPSGGVLTLRNQGFTAILLQQFAGGGQLNVNASLTIEKLASL